MDSEKEPTFRERVKQEALLTRYKNLNIKIAGVTASISLAVIAIVALVGDRCSFLRPEVSSFVEETTKAIFTAEMITLGILGITNVMINRIIKRSDRKPPTKKK